MTPVESSRNGGAGDASLVQAYASSRSPDSLMPLVERHGRLVRGVCRLYMRGIPGLSDDAARAVFLMLAREAASLGRQKQLLLAGWLHGAATLAASDLRSQGLVPGMSGSGGTVQSGARREALHEAIRSLPPRQREPLILGCLCGVSDEEMSRRLGIPQAEARSLLDKGRLHLSQQLEAAGMDATEASVAAWLDDEAKAIAGADEQDSGRPLVDWKECSADQPLGRVSQSVQETAGRVAAKMSRAAVGRKAGLITAAVAVVAVAVVVAILATRPEQDDTKDAAAAVVQVVSVAGTATAAGAGQEGRQLKAGDSLPADAKVCTERNASMTLTFANGARILLRDDTEATFEKAGSDLVLRMKRGGLVAETKERLTLRTDHVAASFGNGRLTMLVGKAGKPFTRVDVTQGTAQCVREGGAGTAAAPVSLRAGFAATFGEGLPAKVQESEGHEFAQAGGGVFLRSVMNDYEVTGLRLDQPKFAHLTQMWRQHGLDLEAHFSGSRTADAELAKDESGSLCWTIRAGKDRDTAEERIPVRAEGDVLWASMLFSVKPGTGPIAVGLAGEDLVPDSLPAGVKQKVAETAGAKAKIEPLAKTTWTLKWALVGAMPDGAPLYEYESAFGNGPGVKGWRAGAIEKTKIRFSGAEFRIYEIKGGALEKVPARKAQ